MADVKKIAEHIEDHGEHHRIERRAKAEPSGEYHHVVYEKVATGASEDGATLGKHPVIKDADTGEPIDTNMPHVWVPVFAGPEKDARDKIAALTQK